MNFDWNVYHYRYEDRIKNLDNQAQGVVKSNKFFPVFLEDGKQKVFKPLSKTKPLCTPYFAYSEVFWSTIINQYFDSKTPIYKLAVCENIDKEFESKYIYGTIVNSLERSSEKLVNLYEIFRDNPDSSVDIESYINFCERFYDYRCIFESRLMNTHKDIANDFALQVLLAILKLDQNYHYENPLFYMKNNQVSEVAPMLDHEFSTMFLYLDNLELNEKRFDAGLNSLTMPRSDPNNIFVQLRYEAFAILSHNLDVIILNYPETASKFLIKLKHFIQDFKSQPFLLEDCNYLFPFNSLNFRIGHARYKDHNEEEAKKLENKLEQYSPNINDLSKIIYKEVLESSLLLEEEIEKRLIKNY